MQTWITNPKKMKNFKIAIIIITTFLFLINAKAQTPDKYIDVTQDKGILFYEDSVTAVTNFHSNKMDMDDYNYLVLRATKDSSLNNNVIITANGLVSIGSIDIEDAYKGIDVDTSITTNPKLLVQNGDAIGSNWYTFSDKRLKKDIENFKHGLNKIKKVNIYEYEYNGQAGTQSGRKQLGIMAQEMREILPTSVQTLSGKLKVDDKENSKLLVFNPQELIYLAINGIKELDEKTILLEKKTEELEEQRDVLIGMQMQLKQLKEEMNLLKSHLGLETNQNSAKKISIREKENFYQQKVDAKLMSCKPNPTEGETSIEYEILTDFEQAKILFYNAQGVFMDEFSINEKGKNVFLWKAENLPKGLYTYCLVIDAQIVDSKKLILK